MTQYLIAHKVRGEPAFDIAEQIAIGNEEGWIIPTSGHRAYPYWHMEIGKLNEQLQGENGYWVFDTMPPDLPEHYEVTAAPKGKGSGLSSRALLEQLGLAKPLPPMTRRSW